MPTVTVTEESVTADILTVLIRLSADWEAENSCYGYRKNERVEIYGNRVFLARTGGDIIGYLFGHMKMSGTANSIMPAKTPFFEVVELYVKPQYRSTGIGKQLFSCAEAAVSNDTGFYHTEHCHQKLESDPAFLYRRTGHGFLERQTIQEDQQCLR